MIGIFYHPNVARAEVISAEIATWLQAKGQKVWQGILERGRDHAESIKTLELLIVLGGDGSTLRAARLAAPFDVPVLCVNLGRLGFLSECMPDDWQRCLNAYLSGDYWLERRLMLKALLVRDGEQVGEMVALNEVVLGRGRRARAVHIDLFADDHFITSYVADGLIAATPTGSTAYALAAGGPVLPPQLQNFVVIPVAPHLSLNRALVLPSDVKLRMVIHFDHEATLTTDGADALALQDGDEVIVIRSPLTSLFARTGNAAYFYSKVFNAGILGGKINR